MVQELRWSPLHVMLPTEKSFACIRVHAEKQPTAAIVVDIDPC